VHGASSASSRSGILTTGPTLDNARVATTRLTTVRGEVDAEMLCGTLRSRELLAEYEESRTPEDKPSSSD
jgi:hypothetical protein